MSTTSERFARLDLDDAPRQAAPAVPSFPAAPTWSYAGKPIDRDADGHKCGALQLAYKRLHAEHRTDLVIDPRHVAMERGMLRMRGTDYPIEAGALNRTFGEVVNGISNLGSIAHKAAEKKRWTALDALFNASVLDRADGKDIRIGTRQLPTEDRPTVYRAVSSTYGHEISSLRILAAIGRIASWNPDYSWGSVTSPDGYGMAIELRENPTRQRNIGDISKRVTIWTADDASSSVHFKCGAFRLVCLNGMTVPHEVYNIPKLIHRKRAEGFSLVSELEDRIRTAFNLASEFIFDLNDKGMDKLEVFARVERGDITPKEAIASLVYSDLFRVPGLDKADLVEAATRAWDVEPGYTRLSVVNAFTRAAHENKYGYDVQAAIEEQGTNLLYARLAITA